MTEADLQSSGNTTANTNDNVEAPPTGIDKNGEKKIKKRAPFSLFKAALFMMRKPKKNKKKKSAEPQEPPPSNHDWKKIVGSMRPLHLQENDQSPPPPALSLSPSFEDTVHHHRASSSSSSASSIYGGTMSQYASANNLQELDVPDDNNEEEDPDEVFDAICVDDMIDAKAEEFIAQFYQQMKLQHMDAINHH